MARGTSSSRVFSNFSADVSSGRCVRRSEWGPRNMSNWKGRKGPPSPDGLNHQILLLCLGRDFTSLETSLEQIPLSLKRKQPSKGIMDLTSVL